MSPNRTVGALHRLDRACAERLTGLADIEFYDIGRQVWRADKRPRRIRKFRQHSCQQPRNTHSHIVRLRTLHRALLSDFRLAFGGFIF